MFPNVFADEWNVFTSFRLQLCFATVTYSSSKPERFIRKAHQTCRASASNSFQSVGRSLSMALIWKLHEAPHAPREIQGATQLNCDVVKSGSTCVHQCFSGWLTEAGFDVVLQVFCSFLRWCRAILLKKMRSNCCPPKLIFAYLMRAIVSQRGGNSLPK